MRLTDCQLGDAYQDDVREEVIEKLKDSDDYWERDGVGGKYLEHVKNLTPMWPQLELLSDFMGVGAIPTRWQIFPEESDLPDSKRYTYAQNGVTDKRETQRERKQRVNVTLLQYDDEEVKESDPILNAESLMRTAESIKAGDIKASFNLFVVEDLSCDVIETLGSAFGIDPRFFRAHIIDYAWNNVRDRWREPPILNLDARKRDWFQLRLIRSRYFSNREELDDAKKEIDQWNVFRRIDADKNEIFWDKDVGTQPKRVVNGRVGHIRSRITFWRQSNIGVILLDPTLRAGYPLWRGYAKCSAYPPSLRRPKPEEANHIPKDQQASLFNDFVFWAQHTLVRQSSGVPSPCTKPLEVMLRLFCAEWLIFTDYIKTRLNQIDWGIGNPGFFPGSDSREQSLQKLHFWRRWTSQSVDIFRKNVCQVDNFQNQKQNSEIDLSFKEDFASILLYLNSAEQRVTNLGAVVNSAIGLEDARNTSKLTVLATHFSGGLCSLWLAF